MCVCVCVCAYIRTYTHTQARARASHWHRKKILITSSIVSLGFHFPKNVLKCAAVFLLFVSHPKNAVPHIKLVVRIEHAFLCAGVGTDELQPFNMLLENP